MPQERILAGQIVRSQAGRDVGKTYVVVGTPTPSFVLLADGRERKVANPKKKNIRHISVLIRIDKCVAAKCAGGQRVTDEDIRAAIRACAASESIEMRTRRESHV